MGDKELLKFKNEATIVVKMLKELPPGILKRRPDLRRTTQAQLLPFYGDVIRELEQATIRQVRDVTDLRNLVATAQISELNQASPLERREQLAEDVSLYLIENSFPSMSDLEQRFGHRFEGLGLMRSTVMATRLRRIRRFLSEHVYGKLIPLEHLPASVRRGRKTGAIRH